MTKRCAIYTRCSTQDQHVLNQILELKDIAKRKGLSIVSEFSDEGISGAKGQLKSQKVGNNEYPFEVS